MWRLVLLAALLALVPASAWAARPSPVPKYQKQSVPKYHKQSAPKYQKQSVPKYHKKR